MAFVSYGRSDAEGAAWMKKKTQQEQRNSESPAAAGLFHCRGA